MSSDAEPGSHFRYGEFGIFQARVGGHTIKLDRLEHIIRFQCLDDLWSVARTRVWDEGDTQMSVKEIETRFQFMNLTLQQSDFFVFKCRQVKPSQVKIFAHAKENQCESIDQEQPHRIASTVDCHAQVGRRNGRAISAPILADEELFQLALQIG